MWAVFAPAVGWSFIGTGLCVWRHPPEQRIGLLIILLGFGWFVDAADAANAPLGAGYVIFPFPLVPGFLRGPSELRCHGW